MISPRHPERRAIQQWHWSMNWNNEKYLVGDEKQPVQDQVLVALRQIHGKHMFRKREKMLSKRKKILKGSEYCVESKT